MWIEPDVFEVPVDGGELLVGRWGDGDHTVLASHGMTTNHRSFGELAAQVCDDEAGVTLVAVDHRGRAGSSEHPGPYGLTTHRDDLIQVLDHLEIGSATLVGHSMGTYIAVLAAEAYPDRVANLLLVDGGWRGNVASEHVADAEARIRSVMAPVLDRLDRTFPTRASYLDHWRAHPAFRGEDFTDVMEAHFSFDAVADGDVWRSSVRKDAVLTDGGDLRTDSRIRTALERITHETTLLWAPLGLLNQPPPYVPGKFVELVAPRLPHVRTVKVDGVNHYTLLMAPRGAREVGTHLRNLR